MPGDPPTARRGADTLTVAALAIGVAVRVISLGFKMSDDLGLADAFFYSAQAVAVREGDGFDELFAKVPTAEHGPLTQILLAPFSSSVDQQRLGMTIFGIIGLVLFASLARRLLPGRWTVGAVLIAAVYPNIWMSDATVMSETLALLLINAYMLLLVEFRERPAWWRAAGVGLAAGLGALARSELMLLALIGGAACIWFVRQQQGTERRWRLPLAHAALVVGAAVCTITPWIGANLGRFDEPVLLSTNDGTTLLGSNCRATYYGGDIGSWSVLCVLAAEPPTGADASVVARFRREEGLDYAMDHLGRLPLVVLARIGRTFDVFDVAELAADDAREDEFEWGAWVGVVMWWLFVPLTVLGLRRMGTLDRWIVAGPIVIVMLTTVVFYGSHRLRAPLESAVVLAAVFGLRAVVERARKQAAEEGEQVTVSADGSDRQAAST